MEQQKKRATEEEKERLTKEWRNTKRHLEEELKKQKEANEALTKCLQAESEHNKNGVEKAYYVQQSLLEGIAKLLAK